MPRVCTVCSHDDRTAINAALVSGEPKRAIAGRFQLSESAVKRHAAEHLPATLVKATEAAEVADAEALLDQLTGLNRRARAYETQAAAAGDMRTALGAVREQRATVALLARMSGQLDAAIPPEPFTPVAFIATNLETGEEEVLDLNKLFPDPAPLPDPRTVLASIRAAAQAGDGGRAPDGSGYSGK